MRKRLVKAMPVLLLLFFVASVASLAWWGNEQRLSSSRSSIERQELEVAVQTAEAELANLKSEDQYQRNEELQAEIEEIEKTYSEALASYEKLQDLEAQKVDTAEMRTQFAAILQQLSERDYQKASETTAALETQISEQQAKLAAAEQERLAKEITAAAVDSGSSNQAPAPSNNTPPDSGFSRQSVAALGTQFTVSLVAGNLSSTKIIVDTASGQDCHDNCPVLPLSDYVGRNGAYAGINGTYFCPASYPSCAGKTNTFDLLVMNKDKYYFNSDNNVYSNNPGVVFGSGYIRFLGSVSGWGRDTSPYSVLSNYPLLISGGNVLFASGGDAKQSVKSNRSFVANRGNTVYIGVVHNSSVAEAAHVLGAMGMENALNLDSGGSTALWFGGYKAGPGRSIPNAILFVNK